MMLVILMGTGMTSCEFFNDNPISPRLKVRVSSMEVQVGASRKCNVSASTRAKLLYASSNEAIATVDEKGIVTGVSEGDAVITVIATNKDLDIFFDESAVIAVKVVAKGSKTDEEEDAGTTIELTTADLTPEQKAETAALLAAAQEKGASIGIKFSYDGVDYNASFEKTDGEDYKLTAFTSSKTATIEETKKLAAFTPYLTLLIPDDWTDEQIDAYIDSLCNDDEGDEEDEDDGEYIDDDTDDSEYTDKIVFTDGDGAATARALTRTSTSSAAFDMILGLRTPNDEDLVQVQITTAAATATIVDENKRYAIKKLSATALKSAGKTGRESKIAKMKMNKGTQNIVSKVELSPANTTFKKDKTKLFKVSVSPQNTKIRNVHWGVRYGNVKIAKNGTKKTSVKVKPLQNGKSSIYANVNGVYCVSEVAVNIHVSAVRLYKTSLDLLKGNSYQLTATVTPNENNQAVTWSSSDENVAKVSKNGKVTAVGVGKAIITVASSFDISKKAKCTVTVTDGSAPDLPKTMTVQATDYSGTYDGKAHGISVSVTEPASGYTIKYGEKEGTYDKTSLTYTDAGTYTVYYQVTCDGYEPVTGSAKVVISPQGTISDPDDYGKGGNLF